MHKQLSGTPREEAAVRSATDFVREARKNLSQAAGTKYVEIQPQKAARIELIRQLSLLSDDLTAEKPDTDMS